MNDQNEINRLIEEENMDDPWTREFERTTNCKWEECKHFFVKEFITQKIMCIKCYKEKDFSKKC
jgi:hypothetical protein